jgi:pimeloyl-ACP methyl ester carboxylesterase
MRRLPAFLVALACACGFSGPAIAQTDTSTTPQPPGPPDQFFDSHGVRIRYVVAGTGEPVILIHGFSASAEMWTELETDLTRDYRVIALDCRGHGKSGKPHDPKAYGIEMVNDVTRLMDHLGLRRAHIVGYSMGGSIALKMLLVHPERFLTAVSGGSDGFRATDVDETPGLIQNLQSGMSLSEAMIASAPPNFPKPTPAQREMMKQMDVGQDPKALAAQRLGNPGLYVTDEELARVAVPTLILNGERDRPDHYTAAAKKFPNLAFATVPGAGHGDAASTPEFARLVRRFLHDHPAGTKP